jgi:hypothetical protein
MAGPAETLGCPWPPLAIRLCFDVSENIAMLEGVEKAASDGRLAKHLGHDVIGWHVTNNQLTDRASRMKRQAPYGGASVQEGCT